MSEPSHSTHQAGDQPAKPRETSALSGWVLIVGALAVIVGEIGFKSYLGAVSAVLLGVFFFLERRRIGFSVLILVFIGAFFLIWGFVTRDDMLPLLGVISVRSAWVVAVFISLLSLRAAVANIPAIMRSGLYLVHQPPGRRYGALTIGSHLFSHVLQYGAVTLLGGLVTDITSRQPDDAVRRMRERRMLLAIHRGFAGTICWSPISFPMIIITAVVPGSDWLRALGPALGASVLIMGIGWLLDTMTKPQIVTQQRQSPAVGSAKDLVPLLVLLVTLLLGTALIVVATGVSTTTAILLLVPALSLTIVLARAPRGFTRKSGELRAWSHRLASVDLPTFSREAMLVAVAMFSGLLSVEMIGPIIEGVHLPAMPTWFVLMLLVLWMPLAGQLALHPILAASVAAGFIHAPAEFGLTPDQVVVALTSGWALAGASSPFTAVTTLVARMARVSPHTVGLRWNGVYVVVCAFALTLWVALI